MVEGAARSALAQAVKNGPGMNLTPPVPDKV